MKQPSLVFVCQNLRDPDAPQGSCGRRGAREVLDHRKLRMELGRETALRATGCTRLGVLDVPGADVRGRVLADEPGAALRRHRLLDRSALAGEGGAA